MTHSFLVVFWIWYMITFNINSQLSSRMFTQMTHILWRISWMQLSFSYLVLCFIDHQSHITCLPCHIMNPFIHLYSSFHPVSLLIHLDFPIFQQAWTQTRIHWMPVTSVTLSQMSLILTQMTKVVHPQKPLLIQIFGYIYLEKTWLMYQADKAAAADPVVSGLDPSIATSSSNSITICPSLASIALSFFHTSALPPSAFVTSSVQILSFSTNPLSKNPEDPDPAVSCTNLILPPLSLSALPTSFISDPSTFKSTIPSFRFTSSHSEATSSLFSMLFQFSEPLEPPEPLPIFFLPSYYIKNSQIQSIYPKHWNHLQIFPMLFQDSETLGWSEPPEALPGYFSPSLSAQRLPLHQIFQHHHLHSKAASDNSPTLCKCSAPFAPLDSPDLLLELSCAPKNSPILHILSIQNYFPFNLGTFTLPFPFCYNTQTCWPCSQCHLDDWEAIRQSPPRRRGVPNDSHCFFFFSSNFHIFKSNFS